MLDQLAPWAGLLGLIGFAGLWGLRNPVEKSRSGAAIRLLGLFGLAGLCGFWIPGAGAIGASGALGLWNHQDPKLALWGKLGWSSVAGIPYLVRYFTS
jgi:hypothetical protein